MSEGTTSLGRTDPALKLRLYVMMFIQYFVQGSFLPVITKYLEDFYQFEPREIGYFSSAIAVGPLLAPFLIGQLVDRHLATEKVLAVSHFLGGLVMFGLYLVPRDADSTLLIVLGTIYSILYFPTLMLTNSLTFHHLVDRDREFPLVRLWGTIGFVVPAWAIEMYFLSGLKGDELDQARGIILVFSAVSGLLMGAYSLALPHTPPVPSDKKEFAPSKVIGLLKRSNFLVLILASLLIAIAHKFFFVWNSPFLGSVLKMGDVTGAWEQRIASIGQIFEVVVMAFLGMALKRYGFKWTMTVGAIAYMARCLILAGAISWSLPFPLAMTLVCFGQALHGLCFGCFLAAAYIYVDHVASKDVRGSMQTLYGTCIVSTGFFVGGLVSGEIGAHFTTDVGQQTVRERWDIASTAGVVRFTEEIKSGPDKGRKVVRIRDWTGIWLGGAGISLIALVFFVLLFPNETPGEERAVTETGQSAEDDAADLPE